MSLEINELTIVRGSTTVIERLSLSLRPKTLTVLLGPNGSGKSTLAQALMGHPSVTITGGRITLDKTDITGVAADERARRGLMMAFQHPVALPGVSVTNITKLAKETISRKPLGIFEFRDELAAQARALMLDEALLDRSLNDGFSGGEKKKSELLQLAVLRPRYLILDEIDTGLDVDALRHAGAAIGELVQEAAVLVITHSRRLVEYMRPSAVHVLVAGKIVQSGGPELIELVEQKGFAPWPMS